MAANPPGGKVGGGGGGLYRKPNATPRLATSPTNSTPSPHTGLGELPKPPSGTHFAIPTRPSHSCSPLQPPSGPPTRPKHFNTITLTPSTNRPYVSTSPTSVSSLSTHQLTPSAPRPGHILGAPPSYAHVANAQQKTPSPPFPSTLNMNLSDARNPTGSWNVGGSRGRGAGNRGSASTTTRQFLSPSPPVRGQWTLSSSSSPSTPSSYHGRRGRMSFGTSRSPSASSSPPTPGGKGSSNTTDLSSSAGKLDRHLTSFKPAKRAIPHSLSITSYSVIGDSILSHVRDSLCKSCKPFAFQVPNHHIGLLWFH